MTTPTTPTPDWEPTTRPRTVQECIEVGERMKARYEERIRNQIASINRLLDHVNQAHAQFEGDCPGCPKGENE